MRYPVFFLYACFLSLLYSCDVIGKDDYEVDYTPPIPEGVDKQFVLLEDYTGIRCVNCPAAAQQATLLQETFGERLIVVSIHAGSNARPLDGFDLRTPTGEEYYSYFGISGAPWGMVNRTSYEGKPFFEVGKWAGSIAAASVTATVSIEMKINYAAQERAYTVLLNLMRLNAVASEQLDLLLWLVEDRILTPQLTTDGLLPEYLQRHVLRGALNGTWGETIRIPSMGTAVPIEKTFILPDHYKEDDCSVVALLCERGSKTITQVSECGLLIPSF